MAERGADLRPALAVSAGLHLLALAALLASWRLAPPIGRPVQVVAVDIVSNTAPVANVKAALQVPARQAAASPEPAPPSEEPPTPAQTPAPAALPPPAPAPRPHPKPQPKPEPEPAPAPPPKPAPPRPKPAPKPKPTPPKPEPTPKPSPPKPQPRPRDLDLDSLTKAAAKPQKALDLSALSQGASKASSKASNLDLGALANATAGGRRGGARGPARAETDRTARKAAGAAAALDASALGVLQAKIRSHWNPVCGVKVTLRIALRPDHGLAARPTVLAEPASGVDAATVAVATQRALAAVQQSAPFTELAANAPRDIVLPFRATEGCGG